MHGTLPDDPGWSRPGSNLSRVNVTPASSAPHAHQHLTGPWVNPPIREENAHLSPPTWSPERNIADGACRTDGRASEPDAKPSPAAPVEDSCPNQYSPVIGVMSPALIYGIIFSRLQVHGLISASRVQSQHLSLIIGFFTCWRKAGGRFSLRPALHPKELLWIWGNSGGCTSSWSSSKNSGVMTKFKYKKHYVMFYQKEGIFYRLNRNATRLHVSKRRRECYRDQYGELTFVLLCSPESRQHQTLRVEAPAG